MKRRPGELGSVYTEASWVALVIKKTQCQALKTLNTTLNKTVSKNMWTLAFQERTFWGGGKTITKRSRPAQSNRNRMKGAHAM